MTSEAVQVRESGPYTYNLCDKRSISLSDGRLVHGYLDIFRSYSHWLKVTERIAV